MSFLDDIKQKVLIFDGSMGRMLHENGLGAGICPEEWNLSQAEIVKQIYKGYRDAGSDVIQTNTFQANGLKLAEYGLKDRLYDINFQSARLAREAAGNQCYVAASIGPLGKLLEPFGQLTFESAYQTFKEQIVAVADGGAHIISFETFTDVSELRIALLAAKENCNLPVICSVSYEQNGRTLMGTEPDICAIILYSMGADLIGTNCSFGPDYMLKIAREYGKTGLPFSIKPNAGLPEIIDGKQVFKETPEGFVKLLPEFLKHGARLLGGCCGTTPEYIVEVVRVVGDTPAQDIKAIHMNPDVDYITSASYKTAFEEISTARLGRIDINADSALRAALLSGDLGAVTDAAMELLDEDCRIVLINADMGAGAENDDTMLLAKVVKEAQTYLKQPFILKSDNLDVLDAALRVYKGRGGYITVSEDAEKLLKKYGAVDCGGMLPDEK
ncbi:bifunctional homocysteine S-methyltransferase/5,10-methylenetetrahydrofolate reductase [Ruminiclostridium hungatei]|uniref:Bifunctional homocysteine S-methyltransferase/5,10-methylenetetrahydrofolate reductase n=1 Tax=Ruminiclostridium hungatei TaxID=48256 RepID=A0A1V4SEW9_RUMHU|nr:homocysteine S-methyltransferase family protein [Ruminiclostridium hungatei]OPX42015.1 bifunctional homocysteine S-methyltransferase/5,10-methylenetetrahydrofolate reductase [Ruminiclostridium hungatei]